MKIKNLTTQLVVLELKGGEVLHLLPRAEATIAADLMSQDILIKSERGVIATSVVPQQQS